ncbi:MAG: hypothetical protein IJ137_12465 [Eubacterium sp.]|nr:hypothetical protein [Eubacterium sp.]
MSIAGRSLGIFTGVLAGLILALVIARIINKDHQFKTEYDEMQKRIRGDGYKYGFYTMVICEALLLAFSDGNKLPAEAPVIHFFVIWLGILVQIAYCIWKGAYVGLNTNPTRYIIILGIVSVFNFAVSYMAWKDGQLFADGKWQIQTVNLLCGLLFALIGLISLVRKLTDREVEE